MTLLWPMSVLRPRDVAFDIQPRSLAAPSSVSGFTQVVSSDAGIWTASLGGVHIHDRRTRLAWRSIDIQLEGRLNPILIPLCAADQPYPEGMVSLYRQMPHSDLAHFQDTTGYVIERIIDVVATVGGGPTLARSVTLDITINEAGTIEAGQHFSIGERLYRIRSITYVSGTEATITFRPPLRENVFGGWRLEFDNPIGRFRLASDQEMNLTLGLRRFASPTVNFIEDV